MDQRDAQDRAQDAEQRGGEQPRLSSLTLADFPGLEDELTIEVSPKCTVLVGKNGAGKSLIFDALLAASSHVRQSTTTAHVPPGRLQCTLRFSADTEVGYEYRRTGEGAGAGAAPRAREGEAVRFFETCWQQAGAERSELWRVENGILRYADGQEVRLGPWMGRLSKGSWDIYEPSAMQAHALDHLLRFNVVQAGVPRESQGRRDVLMRVVRFPGDRESGGLRYPAVQGLSEQGLSDRVGKIVSSIVFHHEVSMLEPTRGGPTPKESRMFELISQAIQRIGLAEELRVDSYGPAPGRDKQNGGEEWIDEVKLDGINIGRASDGTCRVLETLLHLLDPGSGPPHPLLLEEPETGIHPGLLLHLLHELEAYEGQIIISTHSPQVVSWARPEDIRLVERKQGKTSVRSLAAAEVERVHEYLAHDGMLGEFVYGGALDDEI